MRELAEQQLKDVLDAYAQRDVARARSVWFDDADLDALEDSVLRDLLTFMMEDPRNISFCTHLLFCSKKFLNELATTPPISPRRLFGW